MTRDEDDRNMNVCFSEVPLEIETAEPRHSYVEYQTRRHITTRALQKLLRGRERRHVESHRSDETVQRLAYRFIIVDDVHDVRVVGHDALSAAVDKVNWKTAPLGEFAVAQRRPPCDSIIVRLIASPMPMPSGLVVKNASNTLSSFAGSSPSPESLTATITFSSSSLELTNNSRAPLLLFAIASIPLTIKFSITCCNCTRSPRTKGKWSPSFRFRST